MAIGGKRHHGQAPLLWQTGRARIAGLVAMNQAGRTYDIWQQEADGRHGHQIPDRPALLPPWAQLCARNVDGAKRRAPKRMADSQFRAPLIKILMDLPG